MPGLGTPGIADSHAKMGGLNKSEPSGQGRPASSLPLLLGQPKQAMKGLLSDESKEDQRKNLQVLTGQYPLNQMNRFPSQLACSEVDQPPPPGKSASCPQTGFVIILF